MSRVTESMVVRVDEFLSVDKFSVDDGNPHIEIELEGSDEEFDKLMLVCPAGLYKRDVDGNKRFDYSGCLECGTCRVCCGDTIVKKWTNPRPAMGIEYRFG